MRNAERLPASPDRFARARAARGGAAPRRVGASTVQLNLTARCNLACTHCHVESSPLRSETMDERCAARVVALLDASPGVRCLDLTGGAPELAPVFRPLVRAARERGLEVIDRCNLTVLLEPGQEDTARFLAEQGVRVVASLPCYEPENVDRQRGRSVFARSIEALRTLNELGYARPGSGLVLDLVFNPVDAQLPPAAPELEARYRSELRKRHGLEFDRLLVLTNMPIRRWADWLRRRGAYDEYLDLLEAAFNPDTLGRVMCRDLVSVSWDGSLYDCDFNQQLGMALGGAGRRTLWDLASFDELCDAPIATASHCLGCTANSGSGCGGTLL